MDNVENKKTILIVDDIGTNIDVLNGILQENYKIKVALNGESAIEIASAEPHPDIILLDVQMPGMDGYEVCQELKKNSNLSEIPVIFVTALDDIMNEVKGFEVGGVDYITKPVIREIVLARVKTHLELKEVKDKLFEYSQKMENMLDDNLKL